MSMFGTELKILKELKEKIGKGILNSTELTYEQFLYQKGQYDGIALAIAEINTERAKYDIDDFD